MNNNDILKQIKGGIIVSCQALSSEPLHSSYIMSRMAYAAMLGGAVGIRANTIEDILEIKKIVNLPVIGIIKAEYNDSKVYITPTMDEVDKLVEIGVEIIATDATNRMRPNQESFEEFFTKVRSKYPNQLFMADSSCFEEGLKAQKLGFDIVGTTLCGYTDYTKNESLPALSLINRYSKELQIPVIAEGGIWETKDLENSYDAGAFSVVIGTAITRPMDITKRFVKVLGK